MGQRNLETEKDPRARRGCKVEEVSTTKRRAMNGTDRGDCQGGVYYPMRQIRKPRNPSSITNFTWTSNPRRSIVAFTAALASSASKQGTKKDRPFLNLVQSIS